jgi:S-layer protein (TIGR01567 family)
MFIGVMPAASAVACEAEQVTAPYEFFGMVKPLPAGTFVDFNLTSADDPSVLYYDFDDGDGAEVLEFTVDVDKKQIKGHDDFLYETSIYDKDGEPFIAWLGKPYYVVENGSDWYLSELLIDEDEDDTHLLEVGQTLTLQKEDLSLTPVEIDVDGGEVWFTLTRGGEEVDSSVINEGTEYKYEEDLNESGDEDNWVLKFKVETVFAGINTNLVKINSTQLVSTEIVKVETPDSDLYDDFEIDTLTGDKTLQIKFDKDDDKISLKKDGIVNFLDRFNFRINENGDVGGLMVVIEESGIHELFSECEKLPEGGFIDFNLTSADDPSILYYDFDDGDGAEVLEFTVDVDKKQIKGHDDFLYETSIYDKDGEPFIAWLGKPYYVVENGSDWYLSELLIDEDEDDTHLLEVGQTLTLQKEDLSLTPVEIDVDGGEVWFTLTRGGEEVDSSVINEGTEYKYEEDLNESGDEDNWVLKFKVETVFAGINTNLVKINSTQLVSTEIVKVETPDSDLYDDFEIDTLTGDKTLQIKFDKDDDKISLKKDGIVCFLDRFNFKMNNDGDVGGLCKIVEVGGDNATKPDDGIDDGNVTEPPVDENATVEPTGPAETDTTPEVTDDVPPVETATEEEPGFEAVFAIAGLLAVAYLVLRKRE